MQFMKIETKKRQIRYITLFLLLSGVGIISFFAFVVPNSNIDAFRWLVMEHNYKWQFGDFFRLLVYTADLKNVYFNTSDAVYPPLIMCFFHLLWRLNPITLPVNLSSWVEASRYQFNSLIFLMVTLVEVALLYIAIRKLLSQYNERNINLFFFALLFSAPFFEGAIERGNIVLLAMVLMLLALHYKDSDKAYEREFALILIAVAAGIKVYPALLGLLYIKEKQWKESARLIVYGMVFCLVPFAFTGGVNGALQYLKILFVRSKGAVGRWTSVHCFFTAVAQHLGFDIHVFHVQLIGKLLEELVVVGSVVVMWLEERNWKRVLYLCGIIAVGVPNCYRYTSIFMLVPLLFFLQESYREKRTFMGYLYTILFAATFTIPVWAIRIEVDFAIFFPIYLLLLVSVIETVVAAVKSKGNLKESATDKTNT